VEPSFPSLNVLSILPNQSPSWSLPAVAAAHRVGRGTYGCRVARVNVTMPSRIVLVAAAFVALAAAIMSRPPKWFSDFDQSFYLTIAYDIDRHVLDMT
jgi:hypothetical protein